MKTRIYQYLYNKLKKQVISTSIIPGSPTLIMVEYSILGIRFPIAQLINKTKLTSLEINNIIDKLLREVSY